MFASFMCPKMEMDDTYLIPFYEILERHSRGVADTSVGPVVVPIAFSLEEHLPVHAQPDVIRGTVTLPLSTPSARRPLESVKVCDKEGPTNAIIGPDSSFG